MTKYHLNPENGEVGVCRAKKNCPFGTISEHGSDYSEMQKRYEGIMEGKIQPPLSWILSKKGEAAIVAEDIQKFTKLQFEKAESIRSTLTEDENDEINWYSKGGYESINAALRGHTKDHYGRDIEDWKIAKAQESIVILDKILSQAPKESKVVYRYASPGSKDVKEFLKDILEKGEYSEDGYMSTSASADYPAVKILERSVSESFLIEIATNEGVSIQNMEGAYTGAIQSQENEVLLPRGMKFEVVGVEMQKKIPLGDLKNIILKRTSPEKWTKEQLRLDRLATAKIPVLRLIQKA